MRDNRVPPGSPPLIDATPQGRGNPRATSLSVSPQFSSSDEHWKQMWVSKTCNMNLIVCGSCTQMGKQDRRHDLSQGFALEPSKGFRNNRRMSSVYT